MAERSEAEALAIFLRILTELEAKIKHVVDWSEAEALAFLSSGLDRKLNPKQTLMAERSEAEAIDFLIWILTEIEAKINPWSSKFYKLKARE